MLIRLGIDSGIEAVIDDDRGEPGAAHRDG